MDPTSAPRPDLGEGFAVPGRRPTRALRGRGPVLAGLAAIALVVGACSSPAAATPVSIPPDASGAVAPAASASGPAASPSASPVAAASFPLDPHRRRGRRRRSSRPPRRRSSRSPRPRPRRSSPSAPARGSSRRPTSTTTRPRSRSCPTSRPTRGSTSRRSSRSAPDLVVAGGNRLQLAGRDRPAPSGRDPGPRRLRQGRRRRPPRHRARSATPSAPGPRPAP